MWRQRQTQAAAHSDINLISRDQCDNVVGETTPARMHTSYRNAIARTVQAAHAQAPEPGWPVPKRPKKPNLFRCNTSSHFSSHLLRSAARYILARLWRQTQNGRCLRFKPLVAEKERRSFRFLTTAFSYTHTRIYIYKQRKNKKVKEIVTSTTFREIDFVTTF